MSRAERCSRVAPITSARPTRWIAPIFGALLPIAAPTAAPADPVWTFADVTQAAGIDYEHGYQSTPLTNPQMVAGGVACADYNGDGWVDLYVARGDTGPNLLYLNVGSGSFVEFGRWAEVDLDGVQSCGPTFADYDGDGWTDLFLGGVEGTTPRLFRNRGNASFEDVTSSCQIDLTIDTFSASFGDYDRNGTLDLLTTHWSVGQTQVPSHLWRNNGDGTFAAVDDLVGLTDFGPWILDFTFTANFADIDSDGWSDILFTSDFQTSRVYRNTGAATFTDVTTPVISDENGMGAGIGDYDNDGDLDWFVSSIKSTGGGPPTGNRLYRNQGDGTFDDVTDLAGVRDGGWGWASSFADFNNDGFLDLFLVNGWYHPDYLTDQARLFVSNGDGTFTDRAVELGVAHEGQGRGLACFDYDRDGDLDIFIANNSEAPVLYRNERGNALSWLNVSLRGVAPNTHAVGARVYATSRGRTQMRELRAGCNYVSQDPTEAHFGLGTASVVEELRVVWLGGQTTTLENVPARQHLVLDQLQATAAPLGPFRTESALRIRSAVPNPAARETRIRFTLAHPTHVRMRIFDAAGRTIRQLLDSERGAGDHSVIWDARSDSRAPVPTGVYFYELEGAGARAQGKVTVVR
jgi:hypothetical protein